MELPKNHADIDAYLADFPEPIRARLHAMRETIRQAAPTATEAISYQIPTFKLGKNLVHFAGYAHHVGFYPGSEALADFADELKDFKTAKGSIQFPHDKPLPLALVTRITAYRVAQNEAAMKAPRSRAKKT